MGRVEGQGFWSFHKRKGRILYYGIMCVVRINKQNTSWLTLQIEEPL